MDDPPSWPADRWPRFSGSRLWKSYRLRRQYYLLQDLAQRLCRPSGLLGHAGDFDGGKLAGRRARPRPRRCSSRGVRPPPPRTRNEALP
jgi:hypothetical protein